MDKTTGIMRQTIVGIDYGNRYAGTTVICYNSAHKVMFIESARNSDADAFILRELSHIHPDLILIDAPLSLPGTYWLGNGYDDYHFRACDREVKAMSPMFLGGLTARAIGLKDALNGLGNKILETYPRKLVHLLELPVAKYKNGKMDLEQFVQILIHAIGIRVNTIQVATWHHLDALLAFISGMRYLEKRAVEFGIAEEGTIVV